MILELIQACSREIKPFSGMANLWIKTLSLKQFYFPRRFILLVTVVHKWSETVMRVHGHEAECSQEKWLINEVAY